jgi:hypothetical protein
MSNLYLIGGSPRCGKTIIFNDLINKKPMIAIPTDAVRAGVRYLNKHKRINFSEEEVENDLPWEIIVGIIQRYDHKDIPLVIEGVVVTPERVKNLVLNNLKLKVVFVGFTEDSYIEDIIKYAHSEKDWVYDNIITKNFGDDSEIIKMFSGQKENNKKIKSSAEEYGYRFFSPEGVSFEEYRKNVLSYLLE